MPGQEAFYLMLEVAEKEMRNVYILGGEQDVLDRALEKIKEKFSKLKIAGSMEGWNFKDEEAIKDINKSGAELLIVALGSPRQEFWIRDNIDKLKTVKVAVGEGGTLDFVAGTFKRAPQWMNKLGIEWLWRLIMNKSKTQTGSRLKRVWNAVPVFIWEVYKYKVKNER
jgi:N-acetylglucosaminyldiphosphoundecaprenol N-acetyl-beta-D-mannosaminyltransferase